MNASDSSTKPVTGERDLSAALAALNEYLAEVEEFGEAPIPVGHLRAIAAALAAPHIPGHVELDWAEITGTPAEHWCVARYQAGRMFATERHYFVPAVTA